jgi:hypothetical protein
MENGIEFEITECSGALSREQLEKILAGLPFTLKTIDGETLPNNVFLSPSAGDKKTVLTVEHSARVISIRPPKGKRICDGSYWGKPGEFVPSRVFDETLGHGESHSYIFYHGVNTVGRNVPEGAIDSGRDPLKDMFVLDIYKFH